ncbi:heterokaryon incompatibility protein-domain-containing protein [Podospora fimiseda]|uniref:Heterokaryon incompatibility protein-domain-containing protein n=1 Tax=Podospora fimiseda TaxID=252190 RepID=A0AAN7BUT9_9PEZI|nr:heterokaryon incompatibility protein-domain-containing protein [Podospora fimiseda]
MDKIKFNGATYVRTFSESESRNTRSHVLSWNDNDLKDLPEYKYGRLSSMQRRIRLLRLEGGGHGKPEITCELFEVDFDLVHGVIQTNWTGKEPVAVRYEALSWCLGQESKEYGIRVKKGRNTFRLPVTRELALALKYLRRTKEDRILWIDAICINQENYEERNHQVQMMSLIYNLTSQVCTWLGEDNDDSATAINFIHDIMELENFDAIAANKDNATKWQYLLLLMQHPWFPRRWVVQEIALARKATVYCGKDAIAWDHFAVAVELFVEVETATHRLSEVMQKTEVFNHVPQWFEHVSELGASVLVQATGKVFRRNTVKESTLVPNSMLIQSGQPAGNPINSKKDDETEQNTPPLRNLATLYNPFSQSLDTAPIAELSSATQTASKETLLMTTVTSFLERKPFRVDYALPYSDICKDFSAFCIEQAQNTDPTRALDILCRPWAPTPQQHATSAVVHKKPVPYKNLKSDRKPLWKEYEKEKKLGKWDPLTIPRESKEQKQKRIEQYYKKSKEVARGDHEEWLQAISKYLPAPENSQSHLDDEQDIETDQEPRDIELPSWVSRISGAAFALYHHPGMQSMKRMGRKNADPLVELPLDGHRNYSAAQNTKANLKKLRFRKRPTLGHHSLYVEGFILDEVVTVKEPARLGAIPETWTQVADWRDVVDRKSDPPAEFWRTVVADRGKDNRNLPYYYATACKESVKKGGLRGESVDTGALIASERNSIIAEFCRRVQTVIWNRCLIRTKNGTLGLVSQDVKEGDFVCIIFGCSVPVTIRKSARKTEEDLKNEQWEDKVQACRKYLSRVEESCFRKLRYAETLKRLKEGTNKHGETVESWVEEVKEETAVVNELMKKWKEEAEEAKRKAKKDLQESEERKRLAQERRERRLRNPILPTPNLANTTPQHHHGQVQGQVQSNKESTDEDKDSDYWYEMLGEAYIHGMMDGEAIRDHIMYGLRKRYIEIR